MQVVLFLNCRDIEQPEQQKAVLEGKKVRWQEDGEDDSDDAEEDEEEDEESMDSDDYEEAEEEEEEEVSVVAPRRPQTIHFSHTRLGQVIIL